MKFEEAIQMFNKSIILEEKGISVSGINNYTGDAYQGSYFGRGNVIHQ
jgi:hypothetical protein